jgi:hypothetical protein
LQEPITTKYSVAGAYNSQIFCCRSLYQSNILLQEPITDKYSVARALYQSNILLQEPITDKYSVARALYQSNILLQEPLSAKHPAASPKLVVTLPTPSADCTKVSYLLLQYFKGIVFYRFSNLGRIVTFIPLKYTLTGVLVVSVYYLVSIVLHTRRVFTKNMKTEQT